MLPKLSTVNYNLQEEEALHLPKILKQTKVATPQIQKAKPKAPVQAAPAPKPKAKEDPAATATKSPEEGAPDEQTAEVMGAPTSEGVVITFGRFNPPTIGHEKLLKSAASESK